MMRGRLAKRFVRIVIPVTMLIAVAAPLLADRSDRKRESKFDPRDPQCGHWAILRSCQMVGVPVKMQKLLEMLPPNEEGANILQLRDVLEQIGLKAIGRKEIFSDLVSASDPVILHLDGDHFAAMSQATNEKVSLFDGAGRAKVVEAPEFKKKWNGVALVVQRPDRGALLPAYANRSRKDLPAMGFDSTIIDKGDLRWLGKPITYEFAVYNTGQAPLVIEDIKTDCACLGSEYPTVPIAAGQKAKIVLKYTLEGRGPFEHEAIVRSNDPNLGIVKLTAAGNADARVQITPKSLVLGKMVPGQAKTATISVRFEGDTPLKLHDVSCKNKKMTVVHDVLSEQSAGTFMHGQRFKSQPVSIRQNAHVLQVTYRADRDDLERTVSDSIVIRTNVEGYEGITVPVSARVVRPVAAYPGLLLFTNVEDESSIAKAIELVSLDARPFRVVSTNGSQTGIKYSTSSGFAKRKTVTLSAEAATLLELLKNSPQTKAEIEVELKAAQPERYELSIPMFVVNLACSRKTDPS